ncbi:pyocin knob domain-containing protein [Pectobacterium fontis]|uniref:pyocin knob domain-containing protein n=1 Tax=Pectobacterium fontis TaxID=2558042 RepID=UPI00068973D3|nr:pyocin knob domain-containing protein [Pectobacterium fontis]
MSWYKTGTITATNNSKIITGAGTQFTNPLNGVSAGRMLLLPGAGAVQIYEIESVQSDTQLTLVSAFSGATGSGKLYAIPTSTPVSIEQFAHEFASTLAYYQQQLQGWQSILTGTGDITLTTPDGQSVTVRSQAEWDRLLNEKADLTQTYKKRGGLGTLDLNTITGEQDGIWFQNQNGNATAERNYPVAVSGALLVLQNTASGLSACTQLYFPFNSSRIYVRYFLASGSTWDSWREIWNSATLIKQSNPFANSGDVLVAGLAGGIGKDNSTPMPSATPASDFRINGAWYVQAAQQSDVPANGHVFNIFSNPSRNYGVQLFSDYRNGSPDIRYRTIDNNSVGGWHPLVTSDTTQTLTAEKIFNAGMQDFRSNYGRLTGPVPVLLSSAAQLSNMRIGDVLFVNCTGSAAALVPQATGFFHIYCVAKSDISTAAGTYEAFQLGTAFNKYTASLGSGGTITWRRALILGYNAIADANGFYKTASPVISIYADGSFTTTDEASGINVERLSEGVYKITGCHGMHSDAAWGGIDGGVSNPKCRNDKPLLWNDYEVDEDGSITVYTFHRVHPDAMSFAQNRLTLDKEPFNEKKGHKLEDTWPDQSPIDVPRGLFIQVRVNMPDLEPIKPAIMSSNVYCNTTPSA